MRSGSRPRALDLLRRRRGILRACDRERRRFDRAEFAAQVELAQDLAVAHVCLRRHGEEHRAKALHVAERRCKPARQNDVGDRFHTARANELDALVPPLRIAEPRRRAREHEPIEPFGRVERELHADGTPEREADEGKPLALHRVQHAAREVADVANLDHRLTVVTWMVNAHDIEVAQRVGLRVPHLAGRTE